MCRKQICFPNECAGVRKSSKFIEFKEFCHFDMKKGRKKDEKGRTDGITTKNDERDEKRTNGRPKGRECFLVVFRYSFSTWTPNQAPAEWQWDRIQPSPPTPLERLPWQPRSVLQPSISCHGEPDQTFFCADELNVKNWKWNPLVETKLKGGKRT